MIFPAQTSLPTPEQTGIGERVTTTLANAEVSKQIKQDGEEVEGIYSLYRGKHAATNGNNSAFKKSLLNLLLNCTNKNA